MKIVKSTELTENDWSLLKAARDSAEHTFAKPGQKIGAAILSENGAVFTGGLLARRRVIGSTCAERMAVDQLYFAKNEKPKLCAVIGYLPRPHWTPDTIYTPCGPCLEMFWELIMDFKMKDIKILCSNWNMSRVAKATLLDLFPKIDAHAERR